MDEKAYHLAALRTDLSLEQYQEVSVRLQDPLNVRLLHGILGMVTEAGELADQLKRVLFYGKPVDVINILEEVGDHDWYKNIVVDVVFLLSRESGQTPEEIYAMIRRKNIEKLLKRFPEKFDGFQAINRNTYEERMILEGRCPKCGHAAHGSVCFNMTSDNDCKCPYNSTKETYTLVCAICKAEWQDVCQVERCKQEGCTGVGYAQDDSAKA
jgi:NTP pyrophosphatase (non-canonical NTP hydrolase)